MKLLFNLAIVLAFSMCYSQWGKDQSAFIGSMEYEIFFNPALRNSNTLSHPIIIAGFLGQLALLLASFPLKYAKHLHLISCGLLSIVPFIILLAGCLSRNVYMILSTIPFCTLVLLYYRTFYPRT
jgi:hypothetical protein